uniref:Uncharacterized protein n=1 Tax=Panagrolaimus sp. ES5 TaxID=591445 RepID=A0AC34G1K4_9BILA
MFSVKVFFFIAFITAVIVHGNEEKPKSQENTDLADTFKDLFNGLTHEQRQQINSIIQNKAYTKQQIIDKVKEFSAGIGSETEQKFTAAIEQFQTKRAEEGKKLEEKLASMGDGAKEIASKISKTSEDMNLTFEQEQQQIKDALGIKEFSAGIGSETEQKFTAAIEQFQTKRAEEGKKLEEKLASMGDGAKEIASKISKTSEDMNLTFEQEQQQIKDALGSATDDIKNKLEDSDLFKDMKAMKEKMTQ